MRQGNSCSVVIIDAATVTWMYVKCLYTVFHVMLPGGGLRCVCVCVLAGWSERAVGEARAYVVFRPIIQLAGNN